MGKSRGRRWVDDEDFEETTEKLIDRRTRRRIRDVANTVEQELTQEENR